MVVYLLVLGMGSSIPLSLPFLHFSILIALCQGRSDLPFVGDVLDKGLLFFLKVLKTWVDVSFFSIAYY